MKKRMFERFFQNKKWNDYINFSSFECKMSVFIVVLILTTFKFLDVYNNIDSYILSLQNMTIYIFQALIGMLGIILAGLAIVLGVLTKETINSIEKHNGSGVIQKVLVSFEFLAFNIGIGIFLFAVINLILYSEKELINIYLFYVVSAVTSYFLAFLVFYTISLTGNCIRVFYINNLYTDITSKEKSIYEEANEVRIDYLLYTLHKQMKVTPEELLEDLDEFVDSTNISDKEAVKKYLRNYYS